MPTPDATDPATEAVEAVEGDPVAELLADVLDALALSIERETERGMGRTALAVLRVIATADPARLRTPLPTPTPAPMPTPPPTSPTWLDDLLDSLDAPPSCSNATPAPHRTATG